MQSVRHDFTTVDEAREVLTRALNSAAIPALPAAPAGTTCKLCLRVGEHALDLFAVATATGYRLTDDPADLRFEIQAFLERLPPPAAALQASMVDDLDGAFAAMVNDAPAAGDPPEEPEKDLEEAELASLQSELGSKDPLMAEVKRIQALSLPQKIRLAEDGDMIQRTLLFRMYGKLVFDGLLRNPRLTEMEVAKLAKLGTLSVPLLQFIARKTEWLRTERIRNALLGNPRTPQAILQKVVSMISRQELRLLVQRRDFSPAAQVALREQNAKLLKG